MVRALVVLLVVQACAVLSWHGSLSLDAMAWMSAVVHRGEGHRGGGTAHVAYGAPFWPTAGRLMAALTEGQWVVRGVHRVDEATGTVFFRCSGVYPGQDPYHVHFARVNAFAEEPRVILLVTLRPLVE